jgi:hypothetical protein
MDPPPPAAAAVVVVTVEDEVNRVLVLPALAVEFPGAVEAVLITNSWCWSSSNRLDSCKGSNDVVGWIGAVGTMEDSSSLISCDMDDVLVATL